MQPIFGSFSFDVHTLYLVLMFLELYYLLTGKIPVQTSV